MCPDRPAEKQQEIEVTPEMIEAGISAFWDYAEDRYPVTFDASHFVLAVYLAMSAPLARRTAREARG